jgi:hypothetical protein
MLRSYVEYDDIDKSFVDFQPSNKLPYSVRRKFDVFFNDYTTDYLNGIEINSVEDIYYFALFISVFNDDCADVWQKLNDKNEDATQEFCWKFCIFASEIHFNEELRQYCKDEIDQITNLKGSLIGCLSSMENVVTFDSVRLQEMNDNEKESVLRSDDFEIFKNSILHYLKKLDKVENALHLEIKKQEEDAEYRKHNSRKQAIENAEAIFFMKHFKDLFVKYFNKPMYREVATFINEIFSTDYSDEDIRQITKTRAYKNKKTGTFKT